MDIRGRVKNGVVVIENDIKLPEGQLVRIEVLDDETLIRRLREDLEEFTGCMDGLPEDMAERHDYYIHGVEDDE